MSKSGNEGIPHQDAIVLLFLILSNFDRSVEFSLLFALGDSVGLGELRDDVHHVIVVLEG